MKRYFGSFLLLFALIRITSTQVCSLSNDCGIIGGKTRLFCKVTAPFERSNLNWFGPGRELIVGGTILNTAITDLEEASDGFYLTILNTTKDDSGTYICEYSFVRHDCIVTQDGFQALMCEQKVDGHKMIITITYRLQGYLPKISLMKRTGEAINGMFDPVIDNGFLKEIVWRSNELSEGTYNYTVTGNCGFLTACSGTVDTAGTTVAPSEMKDWKIVLIVIFVMVVTFVLIIAAILAVVMVYRFCSKNRTKDTKGCFARLSFYSCSQCSNEMSTSGHFSHTWSTSSSKSSYEAVSGQDVTVTAVKKDTASEKLVSNTDLTMATGNLDLETEDEIQTKKEKRRSKLTEEEKKTEAPNLVFL